MGKLQRLTVIAEHVALHEGLLVAVFHGNGGPLNWQCVSSARLPHRSMHLRTGALTDEERPTGRKAIKL
jgi:hypothetical protein